MAGVPAITAGMLDALTGTLEGGAPSTVGNAWEPGRPKAKSPMCCAKRKRRMKTARLAAIPFFRNGTVGGNFVIRSTDEVELETCRVALKAGLEAAGYEVTEGGL